MKLAFYYHVVLSEQNGKITVPGYLGVFIDALAKEVEELYLLMHESKIGKEDECDYHIISENVKWISLGQKTPAWHRAIFYNKILKNVMTQLEGCDAFIVRSPSPLAPYFHKYLKNPQLWFMIVGDYVEGASNMKKMGLRDKVIYLYLLYNDWLFTKQIRNSNTLVNSPGLFEKYKSITKNIHQIKTTTLSSGDFFERSDTCKNEIIELLYTGRVDRAKGLFELVDALNILVKEGYYVRCNIVGWEDGENNPIEAELINKATEFGIQKNLVFHGRKKVGAELNFFYRMADIYIIPSYHEGFPRTIWEAMANSLPVIATKVGGIPAYLTDQENALLIQSHSINDIVTSVKYLLLKPEMRKKLILNGMELAKGNTLKIQSKNIVEIIKCKV